MTSKEGGPDLKKPPDIEFGRFGRAFFRGKLCLFIPMVTIESL